MQRKQAKYELICYHQFGDFFKGIILSKIIPCGPSMMDYPETSGNLRKPAAEVSGSFQIFY